MSNKVKKSIALVSALSIITATSSALNIFAVDTTNDTEYTQFPFVKECEDPEIANGNETWTDIYGQEFPNYSGDGFVYLTGNSLKFEVTVPEDDMYEIKVRYTQILSEDGRMQTISVNDTDYMVNFPYTDTWQDISFGMFRLKAGVNTIEIKSQYGYASYDTITVDKANFPTLDVEPTLADKNATPETQSLMNYLCDVYGNGILSGQQEIYGGGNDGDYELEFDFIENLTGELPAIRGFDFMNYNPLYGWDDNTTERVIEWVNDRNGIATACWHINVPKDFTNYEIGDTLDWTDCTYTPDGTDFDTNNAIIEGTKEYEYFMEAIDDLAEQLLRLQEANVPIILRPLHEAEGNSNIDGSGSWFWWGKGGAETYKELWKLLYTTLTEEYGLHNIIWEYNSYDYTTSAQWYPGDDYVDIVGFDKYNTVYNRHDGLTKGPNVDAISSTFYSLVNLTNGNKLVSMPENDTIPTIENMKIEKAGWLYFCPWYGEHILDSSKNDPETVKAIYQDDYCINLADLPENLYSYQSQGEVTTSPSETTSESSFTSTSQGEVTTTTEEPVAHSYYGTISDINGTKLIIRYIDDQENTYTIDTADEFCTVVGEEKVGSFVRVDYNNTYTKCVVNIITEFDIPVVLTGTVTEVDTENDTITVKFTGFTQIIQGYSSYAKVGDTVTASNMSDVIDDEWFKTAIIDIKSVEETTPTETTTVTTGVGTSDHDVTVLGDLNEDNEVKSNDLLLLKKYLLGLSDISDQAFINADINGDGDVKSNDLLALKKYLLGLAEL